MAVNFTVSNYLPRNSTHLSRPTEEEVAGLVQVVLVGGQLGRYRVNQPSFSDVEGETCDNAGYSLVQHCSVRPYTPSPSLSSCSELS